MPQVCATDYLQLFPGALAVCGITLADRLLLGRSYAERRGYPIDANQQMLAFAAGNVAAGLTGSIPTGSRGSRTAAMDGAGSRSQLPSLVGAIVVALIDVEGLRERAVPAAALGVWGGPSSA